VAAMTAQRVIIKIGTAALTTSSGELDEAIITHVVDQIAKLKKQGCEVVLVSSGAVGAGKAVFTLPDTTPPEKQVYAAIGQVLLMNMYGRHLFTHQMLCAQVLVTKQDFSNQAHRHNLQTCMEHLLHDDILPIINENDVVSMEELLFTDNDELAGLVASMLDAHVVVFMTGVDGILGADGNVVRHIEIAAQNDHHAAITPEVSTGGKGGMQAKFEIAKRLALEGRRVHMVNGKVRDIVLQAAENRSIGTVVTAKATPKRKVTS